MAAKHKWLSMSKLTLCVYINLDILYLHTTFKCFSRAKRKAMKITGKIKLINISRLNLKL